MAKQLVSISGDKRLDRTLAGMEVKVQKKLQRKAVRQAAKVVLDTARVTVSPYSKTGLLRRSLKVRSMRRTRRTRHLVGARLISDSTTFEKAGQPFYAPYVEYGTPHSAPRPFVKQAADMSRGRVVSTYREALRESVREAAREGRRGV